MHFMVNAVQRGLQQHLIRKLYREELFEAIMEERQDIAAKRTQCQEVRRLSGVEGSGLGSTQGGWQAGAAKPPCALLACESNPIPPPCPTIIVGTKQPNHQL